MELPKIHKIQNGIVVFVLSEIEENRFFPKGVRSLSCSYVIQRPDRMRLPEEWANGLQELDARVLVTAWAAEPLRSLLACDRSFGVEYVCHLVGSVRKLLPRELLRRGMIVTNWGSLAASTVAEHALFLILSCLRKSPSWHQRWERNVETKTLFGRRVGIHGFGAVARRLISLLEPFGVEIFCYSHGVPSEFMQSFGVRACDSLIELAGSCSVFVECEALTETSKGSISSEVIEAFPEGMTFVNVGRGRLVDELALLSRVQSGRLSVGLDVMNEEPLPADSPWRMAPNVVISPHIAGPTHDQFRQLGEYGLDNVRRYLSGEAVESQITLEIYDRTT